MTSSSSKTIPDALTRDATARPHSPLAGADRHIINGNPPRLLSDLEIVSAPQFSVRSCCCAGELQETRIGYTLPHSTFSAKDR